MPELNSRMDSANWLTPAVADILAQGNGASGRTGSTREIMLTLQRELKEMGSPARIVNTRPMPSYTMYVARPMTVGKTGNRHIVSADDIEKSVKQIADKHDGWSLGFMPELRDDTDAVGILMRNDGHQALSMRRLVVQRTYRKFASNGAFPCGITFEQELIVRDLFDAGHMLIIGDHERRKHLLQGVILSLVLFNTPAELRLAVMGESASAYQNIMQIPHALGRIIPEPGGAQRLLSGFVKEMQRRQKIFERRGVATLEDYNAELREKGRTELPRIVMIVDSVSDTSWQQGSNDWLPQMMKLISEGQTAGIHAVIVADDLDPPRYLRSLYRSVDTKLVTRSVGERLARHLPHPSLIDFTDAFIVDDSSRDVIPVEMYDVADIELKRAIEYWRNNVKQRLLEATKESVSGRTGVTSILETQELQKPPVPKKPPQQALKRVMKALGGRNTEFREIAAKLMQDTHQANAKLTGMETEEQEAITANGADISETQDLPVPQDMYSDQNRNGNTVELKSTETFDTLAEKFSEIAPEEMISTDDLPDIRHNTPSQLAVTDTLETVSAGYRQPLEDTASENALREIAESQMRVTPQSTPSIHHQAQAVAAYLGWLSKGALIDIFGISPDDADHVIQQLKEDRILENTQNPVCRFLRLSQNNDGL
ncbi:MAG: FtsK/SpoIIIE domain-containing protein [Aggregatilineales bacterium]